MTVDLTVPPQTRGPVRVVGTGLLGGSVGLALSARGVDVLLSDTSPTAQSLARDMGAGRLHTEAAGAVPRLVVVAAPPDVVAAVVAEELRRWPEAVVTDVASVKAEPLRTLREAGADVARYVGGHPMAGRERSGAVSARADLFAGRPWAVTTAEGTAPEAVELVRRLARDCGATPVELDPEQHDLAVALVSHTPQVAASLVAARLREAPEAAVGLAGQGLRDVTRIAASDPALWVQILTGNAGPVADVLRALREDLDRVIGALDAVRADPAAPGARGLLARAIADGGAGRDRIPGKHGAAPTHYAVLVVVVPDAPGQLALLLADIGEAGVNLEDLRLEHSPGQRVALAEVAGLPAAPAPLAVQLRQRGWTVPA
ncbi:prephenate dehydrogenase [Kineococcus glutinatus]|uniref:Prephenate dehydrogenase n=1 Tax=Kineococcus glutinatus TaxID=1070872 RepID=A0ABP9H826_9ACTN